MKQYVQLLQNNRTKDLTLVCSRCRVYSVFDEHLLFILIEISWQLWDDLKWTEIFGPRWWIYFNHLSKLIRFSAQNHFVHVTWGFSHCHSCGRLLPKGCSHFWAQNRIILFIGLHSFSSFPLLPLKVYPSGFLILFSLPLGVLLGPRAGGLKPHWAVEGWVEGSCWLIPNGSSQSEKRLGLSGQLEWTTVVTG